MDVIQEIQEEEETTPNQKLQETDAKLMGLTQSPDLRDLGNELGFFGRGQIGDQSMPMTTMIGGNLMGV